MSKVVLHYTTQLSDHWWRWWL